MLLEEVRRETIYNSRLSPESAKLAYLRKEAGPKPVCVWAHTAAYVWKLGLKQLMCGYAQAVSQTAEFQPPQGRNQERPDCLKGFEQGILGMC